MRSTSFSILAACALVAAPAFGNYLWTNSAGDNDWRNPANWTASGTSWKVSLQGADRAIINDGDPLSLNRNVNIGDEEAGGDGEVEIHGATISFERYLRIGASPGLTGTLTMTGGTINAGRALNIGQSGATGIFNFSGGTINANLDTARTGDTLTVGAADATAVVNMSGSAAINLPTGNAEIGEGINSVATVSISDNASVSAPNIRVGFGADSDVMLTIAGGMLDIPNGYVTFGQAAGAQVTVDMSGGVINADRMIFANEGAATLTMTGGTINAVRSGASISASTGGFVMGAGAPNLDVSGDAVINTEKLHISAGGLLTISGDAAINISGSTDGENPADEEPNPTFDFSQAFADNDWSLVLGKIALNGGSIQVAGAADPVTAVDYVELFTAAIAAGVIRTDVEDADLVVEYDAGGDLTRLLLASEPVPEVNPWEDLEALQGFKPAGIGWIMDDHYPYIFHASAGWLWIVAQGASLDAFYGYDFAGEYWFWSRDNLGGWRYDFNSSEWRQQ